MKTVLFRQHGGPEVLEYTDFPTPKPKPGEALIKLHASALNRMDIMVREGWRGLNLEMPHINGADGAGEIVELNARNSLEVKLKVGDRVVINANLGCGQCENCLSGYDNRCETWHLLGETVRGSYAEFLAIPIRQLLKLPASCEYQQAAAAGLVYHTAWHSLVVRGRITSGETLLIVGAGGGVNTACLDIAKYLGARVIVIGSTSAKVKQALDLGADFGVDRSSEPNWSKSVYEATLRKGVDLVVDNVGTTFMESLRTLRAGGRLLTVGNSAGPKFEIDNRYIFAKHLSIIGSTMGTLQDFSKVMGLVFAGKLNPFIDSSFPLREAAKAQERLWKNEHFGKITLDIGSSL